ncbi:MAG TPA: response regulator [Polyangiales bacterium]
MSSKRALIVDDNRALAEDLAEILISAGYEIRVFDDPQAALREAPALPFDVALLDVRMPGIDGVALQQHLLTTHPDARFVLMTAHAEDQRISHGLALGASAVLTKPVPLERLFAVLSEGGHGEEGPGELLLVEDDPAFREALSDVLASDGYHCHGAATALEARRVIEAFKADGRRLSIALIDVRLPDESGLELAHELSTDPGVRCLLMSGWEGEPQEGADKGAPRLLLKPFSPDMLLRALAELRGVRS